MSPCHTIRVGNGIAIVRTSGHRAPLCSARGCTTRSTRLCDFPAPGGGTCDKPLCASCARYVARGVDHCPDHPEVQRQFEFSRLPKPIPVSGFPRWRGVETIYDSRLTNVPDPITPALNQHLDEEDAGCQFVEGGLLGWNPDAGAG